MLYGAECWSTTKEEERRIAVTQRAMARRMEGISLKDHITSTEVLQRTGVKEWTAAIYEAKRRWVGHVVRRDDNRWTYKVTDWIPREGKRPPGRPKIRWDDPVVKLFGQKWKRCARERETRRSVNLHSWRTQERMRDRRRRVGIAR
ncbi:hypothetical protein AB6A40_006584 [Gnathostoma spinigerum]|uniref:Endonuclease-reverse transcriptase n=1 Tax=Gnathostoma spinigerum TaxID=75299 RepID=A0ABD6EUF2_9BILA